MGLLGGGGPDDMSPVVNGTPDADQLRRDIAGYHGLSDQQTDQVRRALLSRLVNAPPAAPDATDLAVQNARLQARRRLMLGQGTGGLFVSGPLGDTSAFSTTTRSAGGM